MELRKRFDEDARNYDMYRPTYPEALIERIRSYSNLTPNSELLEIGSGTGQPTQPFLDMGYQVVALEPGENLARYLQKKFPAHDNLDVRTVDFEDYEAPGKFDLVFSATAFHWIPEDIGLKKVSTVLKPGGAVALFWNHPHVNRDNDDDPVHKHLREVYLRFRPGGAKKRRARVRGIGLRPVSGPSGQTRLHRQGSIALPKDTGDEFRRLYRTSQYVLRPSIT